MSAILHSVQVRGKQSTWCIDTYITETTAADWRADGLTVHKIENTIPAWVAEIGLARPWCFLQDVFHFKNPRGGK